MVEGILNTLIDIASGIADGLMWLLPISPFSALELVFDNNLMGYINFFLPVQEAVNLLVGWGVAIGLWYLYALILRWVKAVR
jgi:hypothetical protein